MMQWSGPGAAFSWAWFVGAAVLVIVGPQRYTAAA